MKTDRLLLGALILSVAVNLLLAGIFMGRLAGPERSVGPVDPVMGMRRLIRDLPPERAEDLAEHYRHYFSTIRPRFRELRASQRQLREAMLTEPLDKAAVREAMVGFQNQLRDSQGQAHDAIIELMAALTLDERRQLITLMSPPPRHERPRSDRPSFDRPSAHGERGPGPEAPPRPGNGDRPPGDSEAPPSP